jgi:demethylmenaquinone methyltransferase/2-methoxy-6-polyprenyl-1,4-benzoquinol methylase
LIIACDRRSKLSVACCKCPGQAAAAGATARPCARLARRLGLPVTWVEGLAEDPPLTAGSQSGVQISLALHEFSAGERAAVLHACHRLLQPGGWLVIVDLHPATGVMALPQQLFCSLFETETALDFLARDLAAEVTAAGFDVRRREPLAGGALQRLLAQKPADAGLQPAE